MPWQSMHTRTPMALWSVCWTWLSMLYDKLKIYWSFLAFKMSITVAPYCRKCFLLFLLQYLPGASRTYPQYHFSCHDSLSSVILTFSKLIRSCWSFCCNLASDADLALNCSSSSFRTLFWAASNYRQRQLLYKHNIFWNHVCSQNELAQLLLDDSHNCTLSGLKAII